jgi:hypothetical protein
MLRVINNVSTTYCKSQNHIVSPAHADTRHTERPLFLSPRASPGARARRAFVCTCARARPARLFRVFTRLWSVVSLESCGLEIAAGMETQASNTWIDSHTKTSVQHTHTQNNTHSTAKTGERRSVALRAYTSIARAHIHFMLIRNL